MAHTPAIPGVDYAAPLYATQSTIGIRGELARLEEAASAATYAGTEAQATTAYVNLQEKRRYACRWNLLPESECVLHPEHTIERHAVEAGYKAAYEGTLVTK